MFYYLIVFHCCYASISFIFYYNFIQISWFCLSALISGKNVLISKHKKYNFVIKEKSKSKHDLNCNCYFLRV